MKITVTYELDIDPALVARCLMERDRYEDDDDLQTDVDDALMDAIRAMSNPADIYGAPELEDARAIVQDEHGVWTILE